MGTRPKPRQPSHERPHQALALRPVATSGRHRPEPLGARLSRAVPGRACSHGVLARPKPPALSAALGSDGARYSWTLPVVTGRPRVRTRRVDRPAIPVGSTPPDRPRSGPTNWASGQTNAAGDPVRTLLRSKDSGGDLVGGHVLQASPRTSSACDGAGSVRVGGLRTPGRWYNTQHRWRRKRHRPPARDGRRTTVHHVHGLNLTGTTRRRQPR